MRTVLICATLALTGCASLCRGMTEDECRAQVRDVVGGVESAGQTIGQGGRDRMPRPAVVVPVPVQP